MKSQFIIHFNSLGNDYQAEVKAFDHDGERNYDVYYSISPNIHPVYRIQVYSGRGNGPVHYWRQRIAKTEVEPVKPEFVEAIGYAIEQAEIG